MAFSVTSIGTATDNSQANSSLSVSVPSGGVPSGCFIAVACMEAHPSTGFTSTTTYGSVSDGHNTYANIAVADSSSSAPSYKLESFYSQNVTALSSGASITFTYEIADDYAIVNACYVTGVSPTAFDSASVGNTGTSGLVTSVTSGTPGASGELFMVLLAGEGTSFTPSSGWSQPPNTASDSTLDLEVAGATKVNSGSSSVTYSTGALTAMLHIFGLKPGATVTPLAPRRLVYRRMN